MTSASVIEIARRLLQDELSGAYRWSTATLLTELENALHAVYARRPDMFLASDGTMTAITTPLSEGTVLPLGTEVRTPLALYVVYRILSGESDDPDNRAVAGDYLKQFSEELYGGGRKA